jgi:hypothetical protein
MFIHQIANVLPLTAVFISTAVTAPMSQAFNPMTDMLPFPNHETRALPSMPDLESTNTESRQLQYVQALDLANEAAYPDDDDRAWKAAIVIDHRVSKHQGHRSVHVKVNWLNGGASWVPVKVLQLQDPFVLINYASNRGLTHHADWSWIGEYTDAPARLAKLAKAFKASVSNAPRYKFGTEVARSVRHALQLDATNGNTLWQDAMATELRQINEYKTFRSLAKGERMPTEYTKIPYHIVFDVKFDLRHKARLVAGGNHTEPPKEDIYSGVVGMETIRLGFLLASMNGLDVCAADIGNAFLYGRTKEKVYIIAGSEFGEAQGTPLIIDKGLYGLRSSSARFHEHLSTKLRAMGYRPSKADPDFWIKDCGAHYEYIATFVDDVLSFSRDPMKVIAELKRDYVLKGIGKPEYYLGGDVVELDPAWTAEGIYTALSARTYIKNVVEKFEALFNQEFRSHKSPMDSEYHPESDESPFLLPKEASVYRGLIGSANWIITLGRFDIHYATNTLARYSMAPRVGHFTAMKRVFGYLKRFGTGMTVIDPSYPDHSKWKTLEYAWQEFYPDAEEELPPDMPEARGKSARITCYVDADHAHDVVTRRSVTGIILMVNNTPIKWISKRQKTVETSTYGSELVAARIATELIIEIRYKLRMLGIPLDGPALMLGDNMSVVLNTTVPSSPLKKKHNAIAYHRVREAIAAGVIRFAHVPSTENIADVMTKPLTNMVFLGLIYPLLFRTPKTRSEQPSHASKGELHTTTDTGITGAIPDTKAEF